MAKNKKNYDIEKDTNAILSILEGQSMGEAEKTLNYVKQKLFDYTKVVVPALFKKAS